MKKYIFLFLIFLNFGYTKAQNADFFNLDKIAQLKSSSTNNIEEFLILNDWDYVKQKREDGARSILSQDKIINLYKNRTYNVDLSFVQILEYNYTKNDKERKVVRTGRKVIIKFQNPAIYKQYLTTLIKLGYKQKGEPSSPGNLKIAASTAEELYARMKREFVNTQTTIRDYSNNKFEIEMSISVFEKIDSDGKTISKNLYEIIINL